jgi:outer membrane receptor for ferrienterochelin and colicin
MFAPPGQNFFVKEMEGAMSLKGPWLGLLVSGFILWAGSGRAQVYNVTFLHTPPAKILEGRDFVINGNIIGADQVSIAALNFRRQGEAEYQVRELRLVSGDRYEGKIPGDSVVPPAIEYFCYAVDFEGNRHIIFASEKEPQLVAVVSRDSLDAAEPEIKEPKEPVEEKKPEGGAGEAPVPVAGQRIAMATRTDLEIEGAPAIVSVVTRDEIRGMGAATVADVLDQLPGISVNRTVSGEYRLVVRGVQSDPEVLVLLDGHRINDPYDGVSLLEFPAEAVERIEVVRGPAAALFGSGAFAGAVHIFTRKGADPHGSAGYGLFNTIRASAGGGHQTEGFAIGGQIQFVTSAGHDRLVESDVLTGVSDEDPAADVSNTPAGVDDSRMQVHAQLDGSLKQLAGGELGLAAHYLYQKRGAFVGKFDSLDHGSELSLHLINTDLYYRVPIGKSFSLDARAFFDTHMVERAFKVIPAADQPYEAGSILLTDGLKESIAYQVMIMGAEVLSVFQALENNILVSGVVFEYISLPEFTQSRDPGSVDCDNDVLQVQGFELPCGKFEGAPSGKNRIAVGFFAQDQWTDILAGLDLLAGFRLDYFTDVGLAFTPRVSAVYSPLDGLWIKAQYSRAFRAPTFQELYDDPEFDPLKTFRGNSKLESVVVDTLEFGLEGRFSHRRIDYRMQAVFFYSMIKDSIESPDTGAGIPQYDNIESLDILGTEVEGIARFGERSRLFVNTSWFRAETSYTGEQDSSYITDVPQLRFNLGFDLAVLSWLNLHLGVGYGSERRNNVRRQLEMLRSFRIPAYTLVRAGVSTEPILFDHLALYFQATNIFDYNMRDPLPRPDLLPGLIPRAPFSFMAGLVWRP